MRMKRKTNYLNLFYDREADVLYFSKGAPSFRDVSDEMADEVVIRRHPKTGEVTGFTVLNFSKKSKKTNQTIELPIEIALKQVVLA